MKVIFYILIFCLFLISCNDDEEKIIPSLVGEWEVVDSYFHTNSNQGICFSIGDSLYMGLGIPFPSSYSSPNELRRYTKTSYGEAMKDFPGKPRIGAVAYIFYNTGIRRRTDMKVGFIGGGNMASAMIGGMIQKGVVSADDILVSVRTEKSVERLTNQFGVQATMENEAVVAGSDLVFLAVKPNQIKNIINLVKNFISPEKIIVSILPGKSLQWLGTEIGKPTKLIRTMPNTPALVGEGMTGVCANDLVTEEELQLVLTLLKSFGRAEVVPEYLMDTVTGVSGSSPAYVFLFLEALADAAVAEGMPRKQAYEFAAQSVLGSAKMLLETGMHPGELKDMVCSPGGTTIEAVAVLERENLRSAVIDATRACIRKSKGVD